MSANQALETLKVLKTIIERLNSEMVILINAAAEIEIIIRKNEPGISKYPPVSYTHLDVYKRQVLVLE